MANGPTTKDADDILNKKGVTIIPDILANAGGVAVSYFEWYQNIHNEQWTQIQVFEKLKRKMLRAVNSVISLRDIYQVPLRDSAYLLALKRIEKKWDIRAKRKIS
jgi:glutamate dehydrogenase